MSNEKHIVGFNDNRLQLEMKFDGDNYEIASVKFKLEVKDGRILEESAAIPVKMLFDMTFLIGMSVRRTAAQYEKEVQEMVDMVKQKKHPFKHIGGKDGEKKD